MSTDWTAGTDDDDGHEAPQKQRRAKEDVPLPVAKSRAQRRAFHRAKARERRRPQKPSGLHQRRRKGGSR